MFWMTMFGLVVAASMVGIYLSNYIYNLIFGPAIEVEQGCCKPEEQKKEIKKDIKKKD